MDSGQFSVSLAVKDIAVSREFYEKIGFEVIDGEQKDNWLILRCGDTVIGLFQDMFPNNTLTFNPRDVRAIEKKLKAEGIEPVQGTEGDEGPTSMVLTDPDGNPILFDQHPADYKPKVKEKPGKAAWIDLTVPDADSVRDFYEAVIGWESSPVSQGDYEDYNMTRDGKPVTGICHKRGGNKDMPTNWMVYFTVADFDTSLEKVTALGGKVLVPTRGVPGHRFAVIEDPAGAVCTIYES